MNEKLKKCPFCGGQVKIDSIGDKKENIYMIECDVCGAALSFASHAADFLSRLYGGQLDPEKITAKTRISKPPIRRTTQCFQCIRWI